MKIYLVKSFLIVFCSLNSVNAQILTKQVNVVLGSSGDHGQLSSGFRNLRLNPSQTRDLHSRWHVTSKNFRADIDRYWQIPLGQVNINPNLK